MITIEQLKEVFSYKTHQLTDAQKNEKKYLCYKQEIQLTGKVYEVYLWGVIILNTHENIVEVIPGEFEPLKVTINYTEDILLKEKLLNLSKGDSATVKGIITEIEYYYLNRHISLLLISIT